MIRITLVVCLSAAAAIASAEAQIAVGGRLGYLDRRLTVQNEVEHQAGMVGAVDLTLSSNILRLAVSGGGGKLSAKTTQTPDVDYGRVSGEIAIAPISWFSICGGIGVAAFVSDIGTQRWVLPRIGAELRPSFSGIPADPYVRGLAIVGASTNSPDASNGGVAVGGGLMVGRSRLQFYVEYQLERLNFSAGVDREEQRGEISAGASFRF